MLYLFLNNCMVIYWVDIKEFLHSVPLGCTFGLFPFISATINNAILPILVLKALHREFPWINSLMWNRQIKNPTRTLSLLHVDYGMLHVEYSEWATCHREEKFSLKVPDDSVYPRASPINMSQFPQDWPQTFSQLGGCYEYQTLKTLLNLCSTLRRSIVLDTNPSSNTYYLSDPRKIISPNIRHSFPLKWG